MNQPWNDLHAIELGLICLIKAVWGISALLTPGSRWRKMIAAWMLSGALFFWLLFWIVLHSPVPAMSAGPVTETVLLIYAVTHFTAFLVWMRMPNDQ